MHGLEKSVQFSASNVFFAVEMLLRDEKAKNQAVA